MHTLATRSEFFQLRAQGLSFAAIARRLGVSKPSTLELETLVGTYSHGIDLLKTSVSEPGLPRSPEPIRTDPNPEKIMGMAPPPGQIGKQTVKFASVRWQKHLTRFYPAFGLILS